MPKFLSKLGCSQFQPKSNFLSSQQSCLIYKRPVSLVLVVIVVSNCHLYTRKSCVVKVSLNSSIITQKGESQNGCLKKTARQIFQKTNMSYPVMGIRTCACQGVRNICFLENLACFIFLKHPFWDLPFCLITNESPNSSKFVHLSQNYIIHLYLKSQIVSKIIVMITQVNKILLPKCFCTVDTCYLRLSC